jgi:hypothetical protein
MSGSEPAVEPSAAGERSDAELLTAQDRRELQAVLADMWQHSETLMRQELELLKAEYEARAIHAKAAIQQGAISLGLVHAAYLTTLATLVLVLAQWIEPWAASLIVAIAAGAGAYVFSRFGKRELQLATAPSKSPDRQRAHHGHALGRPRAHS